MTAGTFASGFEHWLAFGAGESRAAQTTDGNTITGDPSGGTTGTTFSLTTALDNISGTTANDTIVGDNNTLNNGDVIDGSTGTDVLQFTDGGTAATTIIPNISNVETFQITSAGTDVTANLVNSSGFSTLKSQGSTEEIVFNNVGAIAAVEINSATTGNSDVTVNYSTSVVSGSSDSQSFTFSSVGTSTVDAGDVTVNDVETFAVTATGDNFLNDLVGDDFATLTVAGTGMLDVNTDLATTVTSIDASSNSGGVTLGLAEGADVAFTGSTGNDTLDVNGDLDSTDTLNGGDGTDTLRVDDEDQLTSSGLGAASNFEALQVDVVNAATTLDVDDISGVTSFIVGTTTAGDNGLQANFTIDDAVTGSSVTVREDGTTAAANLTFDLKSDGSSDTLTVNLVANDDSAGATTFDAIATFTADDIETLTFNSSDNSTNGADGSDTLEVETVTLGDTYGRVSKKNVLNQHARRTADSVRSPDPRLSPFF